MSKESFEKEAQIEALRSGIKTREKELVAMRRLLLELEPIQSPNPPIPGIPPEEHYSFGDDESEDYEKDVEEIDPQIELKRRQKHEGLVAIFQDIFGVLI